MRLIDKYRPRRLSDILGQDAIVRFFTNFLKRPDSRAFLFLGTSGLGKSSVAEVLATHLGGLDPDCSEYRFSNACNIWRVKSGEFTADSTREIFSGFRHMPMGSPGPDGEVWRIVFFEEADMSSAAARNLFLSELDHLPDNTVVIFTSMKMDWWKHENQRALFNRLTLVEFKPPGFAEIAAARDWIQSVWAQESGKSASTCPVNPSDYVKANNPLSYRQLLQELDAHLIAIRPDDRPTFALGAPAPVRTLFSAFQSSVDDADIVDPSDCLIDDTPIVTAPTIAKSDPFADLPGLAPITTPVRAKSSLVVDHAPTVAPRPVSGVSAPIPASTPIAPTVAIESYSAYLASLMGPDGFAIESSDIPLSREELTMRKANIVRRLADKLRSAGRLNSIPVYQVARACGVSEVFAGKILRES